MTAAAWFLVAGLCAVAVVACWLHSPAARAHRQQLRLHRRFAAANGLDDEESRALWRIAHEAGLADPLLVYVRPGLLEADAVPCASAAVVAALRRKLFGG
jgi:hypothetical protein